MATRWAPTSSAGSGSLSGTRILVLATGHRAGPWACRSLAAAGGQVIGAHHEGRLSGGRSSACARPLRYPPPAHEPEGFVQAVEEMSRRHAVDVVLPVGEDEARVLAERCPDLSPAITIGPDAAQYHALCDKHALVDTAARAMVDHPATVLVGHGADPSALPPLPCIVKPRISGEDLGDADAARRVDTAEERDSAIAALLARDHEAVVQQHVSGRGWIVRCVRGPETFEVVAFRVERQFPRAAGTPSVQTSAPASPDLLEASRRIFEVVDYHGPGSACFIESNGRLYLHDVNLRLSGTLGGVMRSGLDVPRRVVELALGRSPRMPTPPQRRRVTYIRLDGELSALADAIRGRGGESPAEVASVVMKAAVSRHWMLDPSPADPFWLTRQLGLAGLQLARRARARASGG